MIELFEDGGGRCGPDEGLGRLVMRLDVARDGVFEFGNGFEDARRILPRVIVEKNPSTALSQEADVGVKWKVHRGCAASHFKTLGCLCVA